MSVLRHGGLIGCHLSIEPYSSMTVVCTLERAYSIHTCVISFVEPATALVSQAAPASLGLLAVQRLLKKDSDLLQISVAVSPHEKTSSGKGKLKLRILFQLLHNPDGS